MKRLIAVLSAGLLAGTPAWGQYSALREECEGLFPEDIGNPDNLAKRQAATGTVVLRNPGQNRVVNNARMGVIHGYKWEMLRRFHEDLLTPGSGLAPLLVYCSFATMLKRDLVIFDGEDEEGPFLVFYHQGEWLAYRDKWGKSKYLKSLSFD